MGIAIRGLSDDPVLRSRIRARVGRVLGRLGLRPVTALVTFTDDNGPKGGPATRCAVTVRLPYRPAVRVEHSATTARLAFDGMLARLDRQLERDRERQRERRRYPKKYYAAQRLLASQ